MMFLADEKRTHAVQCSRKRIAMIGSISNQQHLHCIRSAVQVSTISNPNLGIYGGQFVPETLMPALGELEAAYPSAG